MNWRRISDVKFKYLPKQIVEIETPNMIKIGNRSILIFSANLKIDASIIFYSSIRYSVGDFDGYKFKFSQNQFNETHEFDGPDMYASEFNNVLRFIIIYHLKMI